MTPLEARAAQRRARRLRALHQVLEHAADRTPAVVTADARYVEADRLLRRIRALPLTLWRNP